MAAEETGDLRGMGTTLVGITLVKDRNQDLWLVFNVGDSRLYRLFDDELELVTTDHSEVQELVEEGVISVSDAKHHAHRNVITRALGLEPSVEPDFWLLPPAPGERFLLCSDGLTSELEDDQIAGVLASEKNPPLLHRGWSRKRCRRGGVTMSPSWSSTWWRRMAEAISTRRTAA